MNAPTSRPDQVASVFVYGTLQRHGARQHVWPYPPLRIVPARVQGALYDLGPYPALSPEGSDWVAGERWELAPDDVAETLQTLDKIEDYSQGPRDLYQRCIVECQDEDGSLHAAYTYQFAQPERLAEARRIPPNEAGVSSWPVSS